MAKLSSAARKDIPASKFGLPSKAKTAKGKSKPGSYPMPDKAHARLAKAFATRFAGPAQKKQIDARANKILKTKKK